VILRPLLREITETDLVVSESIVTPIARVVDKICLVAGVLECSEQEEFARLQLANVTGSVVAYANQLGDVKEGDVVFVVGRVRLSKRGRGVVRVRKIVPIDPAEDDELYDYHLVEVLAQLKDALNKYNRKDLIAKEARKHYGDTYSKYRGLYIDLKQKLLDKYGITDEIPLEDEEDLE